MDEPIAPISQKTGLPGEKAKGAAEAAVEFLNDKLPAPIANQIDGFLSGQSDAISDALGGVTDKMKGMFGSD
jgi:hypothetical protein